MPWLIVDVALVLVALVTLGLTGLSLWRAVRGLGSEVAVSGSTLGAAAEALASAQAAAGPHPVPGSSRPRAARRARDR